MTINNVINNSYVVGTGTRNLVLNTFGRVYVKIKDRYYELDFKNLASTSSETSNNPDLIILDSQNDLNTLPYPGDGKVIITKDGYVYITENGGYAQVKFKNFDDSLTLDELIINGQLIINAPDGLPGIVINNSELIENLNAQYLNGYTSDEFALKNVAEWIQGNWTFVNNVTFNNNVTIDKALTNENTDTTLDFENSTLTIDYLVVRKGIQFDGELDSGNSKIVRIDGVNGELWIAEKFRVETNAEEIDINDFIYDTPIKVIDTADFADFLPFERIDGSLFDITVWYNAFLSDYTAGAEDNDNYAGTFRDFSTQAAINAANAILQAENSYLDITDYLDVYYSYYNPITDTRYTGDIYEYTISKNDKESLYPTISPNCIVRWQTDAYQFAEGVIISVSGDLVDIRFKEDSQYSNAIEIGDYFVIVGHLTNPLRQGGVVLNSNINRQPFIDIVDNVNYSYQTEIVEDAGETWTETDYDMPVTDNNNIKSRIGRLDGLANDDIFGSLSGIGILMKGIVTSTVTTNTFAAISAFTSTNNCKIYIKNATISFNGATTFNPDGSGYLAGGKLYWTATELNIDGDSIIPNTIDGSKIIDNTIDGSLKLIDGSVPPEKLSEEYAYKRETPRYGTFTTLTDVTGTITVAEIHDLRYTIPSGTTSIDLGNFTGATDGFEYLLTFTNQNTTDVTISFLNSNLYSNIDTITVPGLGYYFILIKVIGSTYITTLPTSSVVPGGGIALSNTLINTTADLYTENITVITSSNWNVTGIPSWVTLSDTSGTGNTTITITITANTAAARSGTIIFSTTSSPVEITVLEINQDGLLVSVTRSDQFNTLTIQEVIFDTPNVWKLEVGKQYTFGNKYSTCDGIIINSSAIAYDQGDTFTVSTSTSTITAYYNTAVINVLNIEESTDNFSTSLMSITNDQTGTVTPNTANGVSLGTNGKAYTLFEFPTNNQQYNMTYGGTETISWLPIYIIYVPGDGPYEVNVYSTSGV